MNLPNTIWRMAEPATLHHPYLKRKRINMSICDNPFLRVAPIGAIAHVVGYIPSCNGKYLTGELIVAPIYAGQKMASIEFIDIHGLKSCLAGHSTKLGYWPTCRLQPYNPIAICEGVATALSIYHATGVQTLAARSCTNLYSLTKYVRGKYPSTKIVVCADVGRGQLFAENAANDHCCALLVPEFDVFDSLDGKHPTDCNDLASLVGCHELAYQFYRALDHHPRLCDGVYV
jgi:putative DNA primase/helicase